MANWCVGTGFAPDVFYSLTLRQRDAFATAVNAMNKSR